MSAAGPLPRLDAEFRCDLCDAPAIAVSPGAEPIRELFVLDDGSPRRQWCARCWPCRPLEAA